MTCFAVAPDNIQSHLNNWLYQIIQLILLKSVILNLGHVQSVETVTSQIWFKTVIGF